MKSNEQRQPLYLIAIILIMLLVQTILVPGSISVGQFFLITRQASALGIIALGQAAVILVGGIDLSVGSVVMITNVFCIALMKGLNDHFLTGILFCLFLAVIIGLANALGVIVLHIAPFVMTLCTMTILEGICYVYTQGAPTGSAAPIVKSLGTGYVGPVPVSTLIWLILSVLAWIILRCTTFGRKMLAVGGNSKASRLSGVRNSLVIAAAYLFSALMSVIAGIIMSGYLNIMSLTIGADYVNNSLAAVLIGGNAIEGGRGGVWGVVLGSFFMMFLMAILTMVGIGQVGKLIVQGIVIFAVVAMQSLMKKN